MKAHRSLLASNDSHLAFKISPVGPKAGTMFIREKKTNKKTIDYYSSQQTIKVQRYHYVNAKVKRAGKSQKREDE